MVNLAGEYDENAEASTGFDPLPPGRYVARIIDAKIDPISKTKDHGDCLNLTWEVADGDFEKRLFWQRLNIWFRGANQDEVRRIANSQFAAVREATNVMMPKDTDELLHIDCLVTLKIKQQGDYNPRNDVSSVKPLNAAPAGPPSGSPARAAPAASAPAASNPFKRAKAAQ